MTRSASRLVSVPRPVVALAMALVLAGCGIGAPNVVTPTDPPPPLESLSGAIELTRGTLETALKERGIGLIRPNTPYRPPEEASLIDLPRGVFQAVLADDPTAGYLVIYELPDPSAAYAAAERQAAWLGSGPGAVQSVPGTTHVIRVIGNTVVTFSRSPEARDPKEADVIAALETLGKGVPVPSA